MEEVAAESVVGSVGNGVQSPVDGTPPPVQLGHQRLHVGRVVDVELEHVGRARESLGDSLGQPDPPIEPGQHEVCALLLGNPGNVPGDRVIRQHAGDHQAFSL